MAEDHALTVAEAVRTLVGAAVKARARVVVVLHARVDAKVDAQPHAQVHVAHLAWAPATQVAIHHATPHVWVVRELVWEVAPTLVCIIV